MEEPITNQTTHTGSTLPAEAAPAQEPDASPAAPPAVKKKPPLKTVLIIAAVCAAVLAVAVIFLVRMLMYGREAQDMDSQPCRYSEVRGTQ